MANNTRRPAPHHSKQLQKLINTAPKGVTWKRESWVSRRINPESGAMETRYFSAQTIGPKEARKRAILWQAGKPVPERYDGMDLSRAPTRRLLLTRRLATRGNPIPRFTLEIPSSRGPAERWMRVHLGTVWTLDQHRIDRAVASLAERLRRYRARVAAVGRRMAGKGLEHIYREADAGAARLLHSDVLAWTGKGWAITFNPPSLIDADRQGLYWPELEDSEQRSPANERAHVCTRDAFAVAHSPA